MRQSIMQKNLILSLCLSLSSACLAQTSRPENIDASLSPLIPVSAEKDKEDISEIEFPERFSNASAALRAGCRIVRVKLDMRSCLLSRHAEFSRHLIIRIYDEQLNKQWHADQQWRVQSWYGKATVRALPFYARQRLLALRFEHDHGTGILHMVELWFAWNAAVQKYQAVLLETPSAHNVSTGLAHKWDAQIRLRPKQKEGQLSIELVAAASYVNEAPDSRESSKINYREILHWNPATFSFYYNADQQSEAEKSRFFRGRIDTIRTEFLKQRPTPEDLEDGERLRKKIPSLDDLLF
jgi:hypothetical protein